MKMLWHKSNKTVRNLAQAGDAYLAFRFRESCEEITINTQENINLFDTSYYGKYELEVWGHGVKKIPILPSCYLSTSLEAMKFTKEELALYTHFIRYETRSNGKKNITTYRIHDMDRNQILTSAF